MPPKYRELKAAMRKARCRWRPGKGSHTVWTHPLLPEESVTLAGNDGDDARDYHVRQVRDFLSKLREREREIEERR